MKKQETKKVVSKKVAPKPEAVVVEVKDPRMASVGRIVLYHGTSGEVIGPAIISKMQPVSGVVDLHVFESDGGVHLRTGVQFTNLGGWTWPERVA